MLVQDHYSSLSGMEFLCVLIQGEIAVMPLPKFNRQSAIKDYNCKFKKTISLGETFGYAYWADNHLSAADGMVKLISELHLLYHFSREELEDTRVVTDIARHNKARLEKVEAVEDRPHQDRKDIQDISRQQSQKLALINWTTDQRDFLSRRENWNKLVQQKPINKKAIEKLYITYQTHAEFAGASALALIELGQEHLPELIQGQRDAQSALRYAWLRMPRRLYKLYRDYLKKFIAEAEKLELMITAAMLEKLKAYDNSCLTCSNVIKPIAKKLQHLQVLTADFNLPSGNEPLTANELSVMQRHIEERGTAQQRKALEKLSWNKPTGDLATRVIKNKRGSFVIPSTLSKLVPKTAPIFSKIFKGRAWRHNFFKEKTGFMAHLKSLPNPAIRLIEVDLIKGAPALLAVYHQREGLISSEIDEAVKNNQPFLKFRLRGKARKLHAQWLDVLKSHRQLIVRYKMDIALTLAQSLINTHNGDEVAAAMVDWRKCAEIHSLVEEIKKNYKEYQLDIIKPELNKFENKVKKIFLMSDAYQRMLKLSKGGVFTEEDVSYILSVANISQHDVNGMGAAFVRACKPEINSIFEELKKELKRIPTFDSSSHIIVQHINRVKGLHKLVSSFGSKAQMVKLQQQIAKYFFAFLMQSLSVSKQPANFLKDNPYFEKIEKLLIEIGGSCTICGTSPVSTRAQELTTLRESNSVSLYAVKLRVTATLMAEEFLERRFAKEQQLIDKKIIHLFLSFHEGYKYKESLLPDFNAISEKLAANGADDLSAIADELEKYQQKLVGLAGNEHKPAKVLVEARAKVKRVASQVSRSDLGLAEKQKLVTGLNVSLSNLLTTGLGVFSRAGDEMLQTRSGKKQLFTKTYTRRT